MEKTEKQITNLQWHSISKEGLPKVKGVYLVHKELIGGISVQRFDPDVNTEVTPDTCFYDYWCEASCVSDKAKELLRHEPNWVLKEIVGLYNALTEAKEE